MMLFKVLKRVKIYSFSYRYELFCVEVIYAD